MDVFNNVILARNRQLPDDDRMIETCRSIFKSFNINNVSVCIGWCTDQVNATNFSEEYIPLSRQRDVASQVYTSNTFFSLMEKGGEEILQGLKTDAEFWFIPQVLAVAAPLRFTFPQYIKKLSQHPQVHHHLSQTIFLENKQAFWHLHVLAFRSRTSER